MEEGGGSVRADLRSSDGWGGRLGGLADCQPARQCWEGREGQGREGQGRGGNLHVNKLFYNITHHTVHCIRVYKKKKFIHENTKTLYM